ncbi:MAG TPA: methionine synthase [Actinophytocola sp.]|uniref:methionine synthase n=1 Tax=Actinophytocola sp. TaxID=1872138 RepID=UPI002DBC7F78|nr:methionine synthase [Actinophytocola sp.]HEU5470141.1 methionine synthase [Actinophytocola sp.]
MDHTNVVSTMPWPAGSVTGIGSMPGTDPAEAAAIVVGELPNLPHLPELPARGLGADVIGRTAGLLVDLAIEVVPSAYRVTARPGVDHRRTIDLMQRDLDAFQEAIDRTAAAPAAVKVQLAGPWTLAAGIELPRGHRVLTDHGALREFTESLAEGLTRHVDEVARRTGRPVVVQLDEPSLPAVLAGALPTPSGLGTVAAVPAPDARDLLAQVVTAARTASSGPVIVHCCAPRPPVALFRAAGADAIALDATLLDGVPAKLADEIGESWDAGCVFLLGVIPSADPERTPTLAEAAAPALRLVDRLGFPRTLLADRAVATPVCGLAGATGTWAKNALRLLTDTGKAFVEPPESW